MKSPVLIVAAIAGYSLFITAGLLIFLLPEEGVSYSGSWHPILAFAQFLIIPGMAALVSLVVHGRYRWKRRTLSIFLAGTAGVPIAVFLAILPLALLAWAAYTSAAFFFVLLPLVVGVAAWVLFLAIRKTGQWGVEAEASKWLADRQADSSGLELRQRNRAIRWALCIPSLLVLIVLLFLPEIWGLLTHMKQPRSGELSDYEVTIPATWVILAAYTHPTGASWVSGIASRGMGLDIKRYFHFGDLPLSSWSVGTAEFEENESGWL
jgi:hypothetical protein